MSWKSLCLALVAFAPCLGLRATEFTVCVYNVENLFDADGVALFEDYQPRLDQVHPYSPAMVWTKIAHVGRVLQAFPGQGPDVILFQELELDRTPESSVVDFEAALHQYADTTVEAMLGAGFNDEIAGLPSAFLLRKHLQDIGLQPYYVSLPAPAEPYESSPVQTNAVFSRFPILYTKSHPTPRARVIQEVALEVQGHELVLFNNHWKSGASSRNTETARVQNARDLRAAVDAVLVRNPAADIILGGDFNTYYNAREVLGREWEGYDGPFAIDELGSHGREASFARGQQDGFYNLWFDLPEDHHGSELHQGKWGSLMMILLSQGLYDEAGIRYIDNSFRVVRLQGLNAVGPWQEPFAWSFTGQRGAGFSDHFPVMARFQSLDAEAPEPAPFVGLRDKRPPRRQPAINTNLNISQRQSADALNGLSDEELAARLGLVFEVEANVRALKPLTIYLHGRDYLLYSYDEDTAAALDDLRLGQRVRFLGQLAEYKGRLEFILHDARWLR